MQPVSFVRTITRTGAGNQRYIFLVPKVDFSLRQELLWKEPGKEQNPCKRCRDKVEEDSNTMGIMNRQ
jgi:hypothetical protein